MSYVFLYKSIILYKISQKKREKEKEKEKDRDRGAIFYEIEREAYILAGFAKICSRSRFKEELRRCELCSYIFHHTGRAVLPAKVH